MNERGLYEKYRVTRTDGRPIDWCFVLEPYRDPAARAALRAYRAATHNDALGRDIDNVLRVFHDVENEESS